MNLAGSQEQGAQPSPRWASSSTSSVHLQPPGGLGTSKAGNEAAHHPRTENRASLSLWKMQKLIPYSLGLFQKTSEHPYIRVQIFLYETSRSPFNHLFRPPSITDSEGALLEGQSLIPQQGLCRDEEGREELHCSNLLIWEPTWLQPHVQTESFHPLAWPAASCEYHTAAAPQLLLSFQWKHNNSQWKITRVWLHSPLRADVTPYSSCSSSVLGGLTPVGRHRIPPLNRSAAALH